MEGKEPMESLRRGGGVPLEHVDLATLKHEVAWPLGHHPRERERESPKLTRERERAQIA